MDIADGQSGAGWVLLGGTTCAPWAERPGPFFLHEVYQASDPLGTTRITMPVLWDKHLKCIVSNDSWSILKMLSSAFAPLCKAGAPDLVPEAVAAAMEEEHRAVYDALLNGVYKAGINAVKNNAAAVEEASAKVYAALDELEDKLSRGRFLMGTPAPTAIDIRLTMTLLRYDSSYRQGFALRGGRGGILVGDTPDTAPGYPVLGAYVRDMYARLRDAVDWPSFRHYYRWAPGVAAGHDLPDLARIMHAADQAHGRDALS